jgi:hypothetical protein
MYAFSLLLFLLCFFAYDLNKVPPKVKKSNCIIDLIFCFKFDYFNR